LPSKDGVEKDDSKAMDPVKKTKSEAKPSIKTEKTEKVSEAGATKAKISSKVETKTSSTKEESLASSEVPAAAVAPIKPRDVRGMAIKLGAILVVLLAIVVLVFGVLVYGYHSENPAVKSVAAIVPYPAEKVNGQFVTYHQYLFEVDANERAYQNNAKLNNQPAVDFKSTDGKKLVVQIKQHALDKLASDALTAQLASQKNVKVSDKEVNDLINQLYQRYGGKDTLLKTLKQIYGWDLNDLHGVVYKQLLSKDLQTKITSDPAADATAKTKASSVLTQIKAGGDFTDLAKKNSAASDASTGGDLGYFTKGQLPAELQTAAEALQPGQVSDPVKDQYGYEILKVIDKKDDGSIHAQHILIKSVDFNEYFSAQLKTAKISKYIKV
jgi:parvulin-like peptidyl-prolyl isomerase